MSQSRNDVEEVQLLIHCWLLKEDSDMQKEEEDETDD